MATDIKKLAEELVKLTVLEVNELKTVLKDEYGIEPVAAVAVARASVPPTRISGRFRHSPPHSGTPWVHT